MHWTLDGVFRYPWARFFLLPSPDRMNSMDAFTTGTRPPSPAKARLVVAEDDPSMRAFLHDLLEPFYAVEAVADGELAWAAVQRSAPALLLTDLQMPRLDGLNLIRRVRAQSQLLSVPIVLLSACQDKEPLLQCLAAGADDFLPKPFRCAELLACLQVGLAIPRFSRNCGATSQSHMRAWEEQMRCSAPSIVGIGEASPFA